MADLMGTTHTSSFMFRGKREGERERNREEREDFYLRDYLHLQIEEEEERTSLQQMAQGNVKITILFFDFIFAHGKRESFDKDFLAY